MEVIACDCGYSGPARVAGEKTVCPLCGAAAAPAAGKRWRIPCPAGHLCKVPDEWLGRELICPTCNEPFVPQAADSVEKLAERRRREQEAEEKFAAIWLKRAIWVTIVAVGLLASLVVLSLVNR